MIQLSSLKRFFVTAGLLMLLSGFLVQLEAQDNTANAKVTLKDLLTLIESKTDYRFFYPDQWVQDSVERLEPTRSSVLQDLNQLLKQLQLKTIRVDHQVILVPDSIAVLTDFSEKYMSRQQGGTAPEPEAEAQAQVIIPGVNIIPERQINDNFKVFKIGTPSESTGNSAELKGQLLDQKNEPVPGVTIHVPILKSGTTTDINGVYSLELPKGTHKVEYRAIGYIIEIRNIVLYGDGSLDVKLSEEVTQMQEVVVTSSKIDNINTVATGVERVDPRLIKQIPVSLGEADVIQTLTMLPGVQNTGEVSSGINVRGGSTDQNLILLNGAPIMNTSHFFGFFSAFNPDILEEVTLYKSGAPPRFGGRISSIIDIGLKQGDQSVYQLSGGISPVSAKALIQGPVVKDRSSFIINARTTYSDWLLNQVPDIQVQKSSAGFYDLQGVFQTELNENNALSLTGYYSRDRFDYYRESAFEYGNAAFTTTWDHQRKESFASRYSATFSRYDNSIKFQNDSTMFRQIDYNIDQWLIRADYSWSISDRHFLTFGLNATAYDVYPGKQTPFGVHSEVEPKEVDSEQGIEMALYLGDEFDVSPDLSLNVGFRLASFANYGAKTEYQYREGSTKSPDSQIGSKEYHKGEVSSFYLNPELRLAARYRLNNLSSIKMSFQNMTQFIHLISNTLTSAPTDVWRLSDRYLKPQRGNQFSVGYYRNNRLGSVELSLEAFYKELGRITDYKGGADLMVNEHLETELLQGKGRAYGVELLLRKKSGNLRGWVSYTYSRVQHQVNGPFPEEIINDGEYFPANYDKPNDFKLVANYKISRRLSMAFNFIYTTGRPITYPVGFYRIANGNRLFYSDRNQYRVPDYIRTDISATINGSLIKEKLNHSSLTFAVYNLMGRKNPYSIFFRSEEGVIKGYKMAIFGRPIFTITYNFKLYGNASDDY